MNRVVVSASELKREIFDAVIICLLFYISAFIGDGLAFQILVGVALYVAILELTISKPFAHATNSHAKRRIGYILALATTTTALILMFTHPVESKQYVLWIGVVTASDASGLFFGRFFGKARPFFSRKLSPNKTYAGYFGEMIGSIAVGWLILHLLEMPLSTANVAYVLLGFVFCAIGDLIGSAAKRELGVKHSDELLSDLPIVGRLEKLMRSRHGFLDCFDSASLAFIFYVILLIGCP